MKKILLSSIIILVFSQWSSAQLQKNEFSLSFGIYSSHFFDAMDEDILQDLRLQQDISKSVGEQTGAIFLSYRFYPINKLNIGLALGIERIKGRIMIDTPNDGTFYNDYFTGVLEFDYRYLNKRRFQIYSGGGIGVMYTEEKNETATSQESFDNLGLAYQLNLLGVRFGGTFGVFLEAGFGYKGMIKAGINVQL